MPVWALQLICWKLLKVNTCQCKTMEDLSTDQQTKLNASVSNYSTTSFKGC